MTEAAARTTYFDPRAAGVLYGADGDVVRWSRDVEAPLDDGFTVTALEWLSVIDLDDAAGILVVHLNARPDDLAVLQEAWRDLVRWKRDATGRERLLETLAGLLGTAIRLPASNAGPYRIAFLPDPPDDAAPFADAGLGTSCGWAFALAAGVRGADVPPSPRQVAQFDRDRQELSADWSALVLRDGAAFVGHAAVPPVFLARYAPVFVRTIYTDALLLGVVQRLALAGLTDRLALLGDPARNPRAVERLDARFSRLRNRVWWQHLTQHGIANDLLRAFQAQHRLEELFEQTRSELDDYSRQASLRAGRVLNIIVAIFAVLGGVGVAVDLYQLFNPPPAAPAVAVQWTSVVVVAALLVAVVAAPAGAFDRLRGRRGRWRR